MRMTERKLRKIINEEVIRALNELSGPTRNDLAAHYNDMNTDAEPNRGAEMLHSIMTGPSYDFYAPEDVEVGGGVDALVEHMTDSQVQEIWDNITASTWGEPGTVGTGDYSSSAEDMSWGVY